MDVFAAVSPCAANGCAAITSSGCGQTATLAVVSVNFIFIGNGQGTGLRCIAVFLKSCMAVVVTIIFQDIVAVQLHGGIALAGHRHGGLACVLVYDVDIFQNELKGFFGRIHPIVLDGNGVVGGFDVLGRAVLFSLCLRLWAGCHIVAAHFTGGLVNRHTIHGGIRGFPLGRRSGGLFHFRFLGRRFFFGFRCVFIGCFYGFLGFRLLGRLFFGFLPVFIGRFYGFFCFRLLGRCFFFSFLPAFIGRFYGFFRFRFLGRLFFGFLRAFSDFFCRFFFGRIGLANGGLFRLGNTLIGAAILVIGCRTAADDHLAVGILIGRAVLGDFDLAVCVHIDINVALVDVIHPRKRRCRNGRHDGHEGRCGEHPQAKLFVLHAPYLPGETHSP